LLPLAIYLIYTIGIVGMAYAYLIANGLSFLVNCVIAVRVIGVNTARLINSVVRPLLASVCMYAGVRWLQGEIPMDIPLYIALPISVAAGAILFTTILLLLWIIWRRPDGAESFALNHARKVPGAKAIANILLQGA
jgi:hypothetical protein